MRTKKTVTFCRSIFISSTFFYAEIGEKGLGHKINGHDTLIFRQRDILFSWTTFSINNWEIMKLNCKISKFARYHFQRPQATIIHLISKIINFTERILSECYQLLTGLMKNEEKVTFKKIEQVIRDRIEFANHSKVLTSIKIITGLSFIQSVPDWVDKLTSEQNSFKKILILVTTFCLNCKLKELRFYQAEKSSIHSEKLGLKLFFLNAMKVEFVKVNQNSSSNFLPALEIQEVENVDSFFNQKFSIFHLSKSIKSSLLMRNVRCFFIFVIYIVTRHASYFQL